jgi:hypothetical protein
MARAAKIPNLPNILAVMISHVLTVMALGNDSVHNTMEGDNVMNMSNTAADKALEGVGTRRSTRRSMRWSEVQG